MRARLERLKGPLVAALVALAFAAVLFARGHPYDQDQLALTIPYARIFRDALRAHRFPLWTSLVWCGYPVHAEGQGGFLAFPFRLVSLLAPDEVLGVELEIALALVVAALAGAFAARLRGRSHAASGVSGIVWALGGGLLSYQENPAVLEACWALPLLVALGGVRARSAPLLGGALLGLMLLAGWPYSFALALPVLVFAWRPRALAVAILLGLALGAVQWMPTLELFRLSDRAQGLDPAEVVGQAGFAPSDLARLVSPLIPLAERTSEQSVVFAYLGIPALTLVTLGGRRALRRRELFLPLVLGLALVLALLPALAPGAAKALASLPPFSIVRGPSKLLILVGLAASLLAGEGVDALPRGAWLAVVLVAVDLFQFGQRRALIVDREVPRTTPEVARAIAPGTRTRTLDAFSVPWFKDLDAQAFRAIAMIDPNANVLAGIPSLGGYGPLPVARSKELARLANANQLARASVERLVAPRTRRIGAPFQLEASFATTKLYEVPFALPLARLASDACVASSAEAAFELTASLSPTVPVVEEPVAAGLDGEAHLVRQGEGELEIEVHAPGSALLVLATTYYPGWEASVDGEPARIIRADYAFMGVPLPAGARSVRLEYRPTSFRLGLALSALGAFALLALALARP